MKHLFPESGCLGELAAAARTTILCGIAVLAVPGTAFAGQAARQKPLDLKPAEQLMQQGKLDAARALLLDDLERQPSDADGLNLLGIVETEQHDFANALVSFQKALQLAPHSARTHINLGNLYLAQNHPDLAEQQFRSALRIDPANRDGNYDLALLLMVRHEPAQAISHFERVRPKDSATEINLVRAYLAAKRTDEALQLAAHLSSANKGDVKLHYSLGVLLASAAHYKAAQIELEKADYLTPGQFDILFSLGQVYLLSGNYSKAEVELSQAIAKEPNSSEALYLLGKAYWKESRPLDALNVLVRAHAIAPKNTDVILLMAQVSIEEGYYADAIPLLESGVKIAPHDADLLSALGEAYFKADRVNDAIATFQQVVAVKPSATAYAYLGLSHAYLGRFDLARQDFENGLKVEPGNGFCLFNLGYISQQQGDDVKASELYEKVLRANPEFPSALLQLATIRIQARQFPEAEALLKRYIRVAKNPAIGYYKLAIVERELKKPDAAKSDMATFQTLSRNAAPKTFAYEDLFDYLDSRSKLAPQARNRQDVADLQQQLERHPDQPEILYLLAQAYLRSGQIEDAEKTISRLDVVKSGDYRTLTGAGVLLARYRLYDAAIQQFQSALRIEPDSNDVKFDLANAYFRKQQFNDALTTLQQVPASAQDEAFLALLADTYAHLGVADRAEALYRAAITRSPDNDQNYLSLALLQLHEGELEEATATLQQGETRIPASGKILWGLGLVSIMQGNKQKAASELERAVDLMPEWPGSYSLLGFFYFQTGQITKAREVLDRFSNSSAHSALNLDRIRQVLAQASDNPAVENAPLSAQSRGSLLQLALVLADRTL